MQPDRTDWPPWKITLWALLAFLAVALQGIAFVKSFRPPEGYIMDFFQEWASAKNLFHGRPIYTPQEETLRVYLGRHSVNPGAMLPYNAHPPTSVLLAAPLVTLDYHDAQLVWNLGMFLALVVSVVLVVRELDLRFSRWSLLPLIVMMLYCQPLRAQIYQGQFNPLLLLLIVGIWLLDRREKPRWAGVLLGAATAIKLFPGFLFLYFVVRRQWQTVVAGVLTFAVLTGISLAVLGLQAFETYVTVVVPHVASLRSSWFNTSLGGFWSRLFDPGEGSNISPLWQSPLLAYGGWFLSCLGVTLLAAWMSWKADARSQRDGAFVLTIVTMLLVSPITWDHYFLLLVLPLAWIWQHLPPLGWRRGIFWVMVVVLWLAPGILYLPFMEHEKIRQGLQMGFAPPPTVAWEALVPMSLQCYAFLGLFVLTLVALRQVTGSEKAPQEDDGDSLLDRRLLGHATPPRNA